MTSTSSLVEPFEVTNSCEDFEWFEATETAEYIISEMPKNARMIRITASNIDWRGNNAYAMMLIPEPDDFWSKVAGWRDADWTLRVHRVTDHVVYATAYSHDTPTGGGRVVTFLDGYGIYEMLLAEGWKFYELCRELENRGYGLADDGGRWTKERVVDALQNDLYKTELLELF